VREARDRGLPIHAETCPHYLSLHYEELERPDFEGAKFVFAPPPLRRRDNTPHLWSGLRRGESARDLVGPLRLQLEGPEGVGP